MPLFSTHVPPTNTAVRSVPVSACRPLVFTKLTEGAVFVGGCEADGGSAWEISPQGRQHAGPAAAVTYSWSPCGCVHGGLRSPVVHRHEHCWMLSLPGRDMPQFLCGWAGAGTSQRAPSDWRAGVLRSATCAPCPAFRTHDEPSTCAF